MLPDTFKPITLADQKLFNEYLFKYPPIISELSFTNLYMWRNSYQFRFAEFQGTIILVSTEHKKRLSVFPPIGAFTKDHYEFLREASASCCRSLEFIRVPDERVSELENLDDFDVIEDRDNWDYVYRKEILTTLEGEKLAPVKKDLDYFLENYNWTYQEMDESGIEECLALQADWCREKDCKEGSHLLEEHNGIVDVLTHWHILQCPGGILKVNDQIVAFTLYDQFSADTMVCHIEKADTSFVGSYQAINYLFCKNMPDNVIYVNREQDLGERGLRIAKMKYFPDHFVKKNVMILES